jgi:hypothetical protein
MEYEDGMQIIWDVITREIVVIFRGTVTTLPQRFDSRREGIEAGEAVCRNAGWLTDEP